MKNSVLLLALASSLCVGGCTATAEQASTSNSAIASKVAANASAQVKRQGADHRPNIIYIMADDLGYNDLGSYGQDKIKTPHLDQLAADGVRFTDHYAGSTVCGPSRASLLTGLHPGNSPIRENPRWTASGNAVELGPDDVTVAEVLQDAGYQTAAIGKWAMADGKEFNAAAMPNQQGFDYFVGYKTHKAAHHYYWHELFKNNEPYILKENTNYKKHKGKYTHDLFTEEALSYIDRVDPNRPFFLYLPYTIPHYELTVPEDSKEQYKDLGWAKRKMGKRGSYYNDKEGNVTYAAMVSRMDRDIGRIMKLLEQKGMSENTVVIFTSDNGHEYDKNFFNSNGVFKGKKRDLYEGGIRIPFIAKWPAKMKGGQTTEHVSAFWDFLATACELAEVDSCPATDGISYVPTLVGDEKMQRKHEYLYWEFNERKGPIQAVRMGNWKMVKYLDKAPELFDLSKDQSEENNVAKVYPEITAVLLDKLQNARTPHKEFPLVPKKNKK